MSRWLVLAAGGVVLIASCDFTKATSDYCAQTGKCPDATTDGGTARDGGQPVRDGGTADAGHDGGQPGNDGGVIDGGGLDDDGGFDDDAGIDGGDDTDGGNPDGGCFTAAECGSNQTCISGMCCESDQALCAQSDAGASCDMQLLTDSCGLSRMVTCAQCACDQTCSGGACVPLGLIVGELCQTSCATQCAVVSTVPSIGACGGVGPAACCLDIGQDVGFCTDQHCSACCSGCQLDGGCADATMCGM